MQCSNFLLPIPLSTNSGKAELKYWIQTKTSFRTLRAGASFPEKQTTLFILSAAEGTERTLECHVIDMIWVQGKILLGPLRQRRLPTRMRGTIEASSEQQRVEVRCHSEP